MTSTETSAFTQKTLDLYPAHKWLFIGLNVGLTVNQCHRRYALVGFVATTDHWAHLFNPFLYLQKRHYR